MPYHALPPTIPLYPTCLCQDEIAMKPDAGYHYTHVRPVKQPTRRILMNYKRFFIASIVIFVFALVWNGIVHLIILREADSILYSIGRQESQRNIFLSLLVTVIVSILFVWSYSRTARQGDFRDGITHGLFFGILAGVLVDLNQYVLYPIPASLAITWFAFGLVEFCIYGILVSKIYPTKDKKAA